MNIRIRYFALLHETTEKNEETLTLPAEATVAALREMLLARYPRLLTVMERSLCAINHQYVALHCSTKNLTRRFVAPNLFPCESFFLSTPSHLALFPLPRRTITCPERSPRVISLKSSAASSMLARMVVQISRWHFSDADLIDILVRQTCARLRESRVIWYVFLDIRGWLHRKSQATETEETGTGRIDRR